MWSDIKTQLDRVSRSFALCIPLLEDGLKETIGLSYLLLRALDCIEDSQIEKEKKELLYSLFSDLIKNSDKKNNEATIALFEKREWKGIKKVEAEFMTSGAFARTLRYYWDLDENYRSIIASCIEEMAFGMKKYSSPDNKTNFIVLESGTRILRNQKSYDDYCYYVAGTVGLLLTKITLKFYSSKLTMSDSMKNLALAFGRVLQKVNIIKDCREDYQRGLCFLPKVFLTKISCNIDRINLKLILKDLEQDLVLARDYIFSLPDNYKRFKKFCLLALMPAYKTLIYIMKNQDLFYQKDESIKIPKAQMLKCFAEVMASSVKKESLEALHQELYSQPFLSPTVA